jgi:hypothetical protein
MFRNESTARLKTQFKKIMTKIDDDQVDIAAAAIINIPELWDEAEESSQIKIKEFIARCEGPVFVKIARRCLETECLHEYAAERVKQLEFTEFAQVIASGVVDECIEPSVNLFCSAGSWIEANRIYADCISPLLEELHEDHILRIIKSPKEESSDLDGSTGFATFLEKVVETGKLSREQLIVLLNENDLQHRTEYFKEIDNSSISEIERLEDLPF